MLKLKPVRSAKLARITIWLVLLPDGSLHLEQDASRAEQCHGSIDVIYNSLDYDLQRDIFDPVIEELIDCKIAYISHNRLMLR